MRAFYGPNDQMSISLSTWIYMDMGLATFLVNCHVFGEVLVSHSILINFQLDSYFVLLHDRFSIVFVGGIFLFFSLIQFFESIFSLVISISLPFPLLTNVCVFFFSILFIILNNIVEVCFTCLLFCYFSICHPFNFSMYTIS